jgi:hypothetical protein
MFRLCGRTAYVQDSDIVRSPRLEGILERMHSAAGMPMQLGEVFQITECTCKNQKLIPKLACVAQISVSWHAVGKSHFYDYCIHGSGLRESERCGRARGTQAT